MPVLEMKVTSQNDLVLMFNDTMIIRDIYDIDLYIQIYGPDNQYVFRWTAEYTKN